MELMCGMLIDTYGGRLRQRRRTTNGPGIQAPMRLIFISCVLIAYLDTHVAAQNATAVQSAAQLAAAIKNGASTILLQSQITGLPNERLSEGLQAGGASQDHRYVDFPEVRCLVIPTAVQKTLRR